MNLRKPIQAALIDLSGTIHVGPNAIPGAIEACRRLHENSKLKIRFLTNTADASSSTLLQTLRSIGFDESAVPTGSIRTSLSNTRDYILKEKLRPYLLVDDEILPDLTGIDASPPFDSVVIGSSKTAMNYENLNQAFRLLMSLENGKLLAIHRSKYFQDDDHELSLGPGGFVACLEEATGIEALTMGKPGLAFFQAAVEEMNVDAGAVVKVGDDARQDINGALSAGIGTGVLVKTGKYREGDEKCLDTGGLVVDSINEAVDFILDNC